MYFGEGCYGVQTAAQTYFGKDVKDLSLAECASIVGITNMPTYYDPFYNEENNKKRQETILREMYEQGYIDYAMYKGRRGGGACVHPQRRGRRSHSGYTATTRRSSLTTS